MDEDEDKDEDEDEDADEGDDEDGEDSNDDRAAAIPCNPWMTSVQIHPRKSPCHSNQAATCSQWPAVFAWQILVLRLLKAKRAIPATCLESSPCA